MDVDQQYEYVNMGPPVRTDLRSTTFSTTSATPQ